MRILGKYIHANLWEINPCESLGNISVQSFRKNFPANLCREFRSTLFSYIYIAVFSISRHTSEADRVCIYTYRNHVGPSTSRDASSFIPLSIHRRESELSPWHGRSKTKSVQKKRCGVVAIVGKRGVHPNKHLRPYDNSLVRWEVTNVAIDVEFDGLLRS